MGQELNYLNKKEILINKLNSMGCNLLRDDSDIDFGLIDKKREDEVYNFLIDENFICTGRDKSKMNFKKFIESKIIDIDIEINTKYLKGFFYDIDIIKEFEDEYFKNPKRNQVGMKSLRYMLLLRGKISKYKIFFEKNRDIIEENNFYIDKLTKSPFRKKINFNIFFDVVQGNKVTILKYLKWRYIFYFIWIKIKFKLLKKRGLVIAIDGVDGSGKTTIIEILKKELSKPTIYMGERGYKYEKFYRREKHILLKPLSLIGQYIEKIYRAIKARKLAKLYGVVFCDRYHQYSKTASSIKWIDYWNRLFFSFYPKPDKYIVFWNTSDIILSRKQEVTKEYIDELNRNKESIYKGAIFIKNDNIDDTLNLILREIYA